MITGEEGGHPLFKVVNCDRFTIGDKICLTSLLEASKLCVAGVGVFFTWPATGDEGVRCFSMQNMECATFSTYTKSCLKGSPAFVSRVRNWPATWFFIRKNKLDKESVNNKNY